MSFVLEAQRRDAASSDPDAAARAAYQESQRARRNRLLVIAGLLLTATLSAGLVWWATQTNERKTPAPTSTSTEPMEAAQTPPTIAPAVQLETPLAPEPEPRPAPAPMPTLDISQIPAATQAELLAFQYSSHIYAEDASERMIVVDGERLRVGDRHQGWQLVEISEEGVVWTDSIRRVEVPVLAMW